MKNLLKLDILFVFIAFFSAQAIAQQTNQDFVDKTKTRQIVKSYERGEKLNKEDLELIEDFIRPNVEKKLQNSLAEINILANLLIEDFASDSLPNAWSIVDSAGNGEIWQFNNPGNRAINTSTDTNGFAIFDSDNYGNNGTPENCDLITPLIDCSSTSLVILTFEHFFRAGFGGMGLLSASPDSGNTWFAIDSWDSVSTVNAQFEVYDISSIVAGQSQVLIRWNWRGNFSQYWAIDDVAIFEPTSGILSASTDSVNFGAVNIGGSDSIIVNLTNTGSLVNISAITSDNPDFLILDAPTSIAPAGTASFIITFAPSSIGRSIATISIDHDGINANSKALLTVAVEGLGTLVPTVALPWFEEFPSRNFDQATWDLASFNGISEIVDVSGVSIGSFPFELPSSPFMMEISGETAENGGYDEVVTGYFDLSGSDSLLLSFRKSEHDLELDEYLLISYLANSGAWKTLDTLAGKNNGFGNYEPFEEVLYNLPSDAYHSQFRLRFTASPNMVSTDEYFFDNIQLLKGVILAPPQNLVANPGRSTVTLFWAAPGTSSQMKQENRNLPFDRLNHKSNAGGSTRQDIEVLKTKATNIVQVLLRYIIYRSVDGQNFEAIDSVNAPATAYTDSSVSNFTTYWYYVTALYEEGESAPSNTVEAQLVPLGETIEFEEIFADSIAPAGWLVIDNDSSGSAWEFRQVVGFGSGDSVKAQAGQSFWYSNLSNAKGLLIDEYLVSPRIPAASFSTLRFYAGAFDNGFDDSLRIWISTTGNEINDFTNLIAHFKVDGPPGNWTEYVFNILQFAGQDIYFAVNYYHTNGGLNGSSSDNLWVDHFIITSDSTLVSVDTRERTVHPDFTLQQNYPNPFNPTTTLRYGLRETAQVKLTIYNLLGQSVRTLVNEKQTSGYREVKWDGINNLGEQASSGIYIYRLEANDFVQTKKMVLIR